MIQGYLFYLGPHRVDVVVKLADIVPFTLPRLHTDCPRQLLLHVQYLGLCVSPVVLVISLNIFGLPVELPLQVVLNDHNCLGLPVGPSFLPGAILLIVIPGRLPRQAPYHWCLSIMTVLRELKLTKRMSASLSYSSVMS